MVFDDDDRNPYEFTGFLVGGYSLKLTPAEGVKSRAASARKRPRRSAPSPALRRRSMSTTVGGRQHQKHMTVSENTYEFIWFLKMMIIILMNLYDF